MSVVRGRVGAQGGPFETSKKKSPSSLARQIRRRKVDTAQEDLLGEIKGVSFGESLTFSFLDPWKPSEGRKGGRRGGGKHHQS